MVWVSVWRRTDRQAVVLFYFFWYSAVSYRYIPYIPPTTISFTVPTSERQMKLVGGGTERWGVWWTWMGAEVRRCRFASRFSWHKDHGRTDDWLAIAIAVHVVWSWNILIYGYFNGAWDDDVSLSLFFSFLQCFQIATRIRMLDDWSRRADWFIHSIIHSQQWAQCPF